MKTIQEMIERLLQQVLVQLSIDVDTVHVGFPNDSKNGDFYSNVALICAKEMSKQPRVVAGTIKIQLETNGLPQMISHVEIAGPGFINFYLSSQYFVDEVDKINVQGDAYGKSSIHAGEKILVEHSSPNLFKPFHIGHVMNNTIGEAIVRLAKFSGADVDAISYPSDISLGIGKAVWAIANSGKSLGEFQTLEEQLSFIGECYVHGTNAFDENPESEIEIRSLTKDLMSKTPGVAFDIYMEGKETSLKYFVETASRLGSTFDAYIFESEAGSVGEKIVRSNVGKVFEESDGAVVYKGEKHGLHTRVFINQVGVPTYEAKDVGLLSLKFERYNPNISIFVTDHQQGAYFQVVVTAAGEVNPLWKERTIHRTHGRMSFKGQKMSSRLGGVPIASEVLDAIVEDVKLRSQNLTSEQVDAIATAALKFAILRVVAGKNINFDPETSLSFEGDSGPYLQYTATRATSILAKAESLGLFEQNLNKEGSVEINDVARTLVQFPVVVEKAISDWAPHHVALYLIELARSFNSWYGNTKILDPENSELQYNLRLTNAIRIAIKNGLWLLGMETPEKM